jgi:hypothetical protein
MHSNNRKEPIMETIKPERVQCPQCNSWQSPNRMVTSKILRRAYNHRNGKRETQYQFLAFCKNTPCASRYQAGALG